MDRVYSYNPSTLQEATQLKKHTVSKPARLAMHPSTNEDWTRNVP